MQGIKIMKYNDFFKYLIDKGYLYDDDINNYDYDYFKEFEKFYCQEDFVVLFIVDDIEDECAIEEMYFINVKEKRCFRKKDFYYYYEHKGGKDVILQECNAYDISCIIKHLLSYIMNN